MACHLLHGGMSAEDHKQSLKMFLDTGGILVATGAIMRGGIALADVTDLVLYDAPHHKATMQQVLGRFDRVGRQSQLSVYVLVPSNSIGPHMSGRFALLREVLNTATSTQPAH
jgi:ATP-dependent helicase YprA (DUF1998 family)